MRQVVVLLGVFVLLSASACSGSLSGQVSSKAQQTPVPSATVKVGDQTAVTDTEGRFTLDEVPTGERTVVVTAAGFGPSQQATEVQRGENTLNVALLDGTVTGVITENAEVKEPLKKVKVTLAGVPVKVEGKHFTAVGIPVGTQTLVVKAPGHETYKSTLEVAPGDNSAEVTLNLTPTETYLRYYQAYRFDRLRLAYRFLHKDIKKHDSYKHFAKEMGDVSDILGIKLFEPRSMGKWKCAWTKKTYKDVVAIDRATRHQTVYGAYTDNRTQHWQQIDGRWYLIYDWRD
jgi:hypothetical protein